MTSKVEQKRCPFCMTQTLYIVSQTWTRPIIEGTQFEECFLETKCDACNKQYRWKLVSEET